MLRRGGAALGGLVAGWRYAERLVDEPVPELAGDRIAVRRTSKGFRVRWDDPCIPRGLSSVEFAGGLRDLTVAISYPVADACPGNLLVGVLTVRTSGPVDRDAIVVRLDV